MDEGKSLVYVDESNDEIILKAKVEQYEEEMSVLIEKLKQSEADKAALRAKLTTNVDESRIEALEAEIGELKDRVKFEMRNNDALQQKNDQLEAKLQKLEADYNGAAKKLEAVEPRKPVKRQGRTKASNELDISDPQFESYHSVMTALHNEKLRDYEYIEEARTGMEILWKDYQELVAYVNLQRREMIFRNRRITACMKEQDRAAKVRDNAENTISTLMGVISNLQERLEQATTVSDDKTFSKPLPIYDNSHHYVGQLLSSV